MSGVSSYAAAAAPLDALEPEVATAEELAALIAAAGRLRSRLDAFDVRAARRARSFSNGGKAATGAAVTDALVDRGRRSTRDAKAAADRAGVCDQMPAVEAALAAGAIAAGHVDAIANAARNLDDAARCELAGMAEDLVAVAAWMPVGDFERDVRDVARLLGRDRELEVRERQRRERSVRDWIDKASGMHHWHAVLDPETGQKVATAMSAHVASVCQRDGNAGEPMERLRADAFTELVTRTATGDRRVAEVVVHVDLQTLQTGLHEATVCETEAGVALPVETVRRRACEAEIVPVVLNGDGMALDVGRSSRLATPDQRRALAAMHRTCAFPGCMRAFTDCEIHHVDWWEHDGQTNLARLAPLCERHHHLVHEGGWHIDLRPDRTLTVTRPDGTVEHHPTLDRRRPPPRAA